MKGGEICVDSRRRRRRRRNNAEAVAEDEAPGSACRPGPPCAALHRLFAALRQDK